MNLRNSLSAKVSVIVVLLFLCGLGGLIKLGTVYSHQAAMSVYRQAAIDTTGMISRSLTAPVKFRQVNAIEGVYKGLVSVPENTIAAIRVSDAQGAELTTYRDAQLPAADFAPLSSAKPEPDGDRIAVTNDAVLISTPILNSAGDQQLGTLEIAWNTQALSESMQAIARKQLLLGVMVLLVSGALITLVLNRLVSRPLATMVGNMKRMASGDYEVEIEGLKRSDEIGAMSQALLVFRNTGREMAKMRDEQETQRQRSEAERKAMLQEMANSFESSIKDILAKVLSASQRLSEQTRVMSSAATNSGEQAGHAARSAESASANVSAVAAATEEMSATINEISQQVQLAARQTTEVGEASAVANHQVEALLAASTKINEIIALIEAIANQTNLLALNATIEAARAGEAGKGFAVVAGEVKALATQTTKATEDIRLQTSEILSTTQGVVSTIRNIADLTGKSSSISAAVAAAVEEQGVATQEIVSNTTQASDGTSKVSTTIVSLAKLAQETGELSREVMQAVAALSKDAQHMNDEIGSFLRKVRAQS